MIAMDPQSSLFKCEFSNGKTKSLLEVSSFKFTPTITSNVLPMNISTFTSSIWSKTAQTPSTPTNVGAATECDSLRAESQVNVGCLARPAGMKDLMTLFILIVSILYLLCGFIARNTILGRNPCEMTYSTFAPNSVPQINVPEGVLRDIVAENLISNSSNSSRMAFIDGYMKVIFPKIGASNY